MGKPEKLKWNSISVVTKLEILNEIAKGARSKDIQAKYDISSSNLSTIIKNKEKVRNIAAECQVDKAKKRIRRSAHADIEESTYKWILDCKARKISIGGPLVKLKARNFGIMMGKEFQPSNGWLTRFKKRYNLRYKTVCGEAGSVDEKTVKEW